MQPHSTPDTSTVKTCAKCGQTKPATTEYFHRKKGKLGGFRSVCKECNAEQSRAWYAANRERKLEYTRVYHAANREHKLEYNRAYRAANRERMIEYDRVYNNANKERKSEYNRVYRAVNREHLLEYYRAYNIANREKRRAYHEANRERDARRFRVWRLANKERVLAKGRRRRARKRNAEGTHTAADIEAQYERQKGTCYYCGVKVGDTYHVDHIVPLSRGGSNWPDNLVIACPTCNQSKRDKLPHEWIEGGRLL